MSSYIELPPNKKGEPGIKITVEEGYDDRGERIRFTKTVRFKNLSDRAIKKAIRDFELEVATSQKKKKGSSNTFEEFVNEKWMPLHVKAKLGIRTFQTYNPTVKNYIIPYFGKMKMNKIKAYHIEEFFAHEKQENRKNLKGKYLILKSIFTKALKWKVIGEDPMQGVDIPKSDERTRKKKYYTEEELMKLFEVLENVYPKHRIAFKMAALLGLRKSEILGIRHHSINYEENSILIDAQLHYDAENKKFLLGPPKRGSVRVVMVPPSFMEEIREYAESHKKQRRECGNAWTPIYDENNNEIDLLFTNPYGYPNHLNSISNEWSKFLKRYNLPYINFHGLRHSFASYLVENDGDYKTIQEQLGHTNVNITIGTYSHLTDKKRLKEVTKLEKLLKR